MSPGLVSLTAPITTGPVLGPDPRFSPLAVASSAGRAVSADQAIGVRYEITQDGQHGIHGQLVIANNGSAPVSGWRVTVVLPGDTNYQVLNAGNRSAGDALVMAAPTGGHSLTAGSTTSITFTAWGSTSTPVRCTFTDAARQQHSRDGSGHPSSGAAGQDSSRAGGQGPGQGRHDGWLGGWLSRGWSGGGWPGGGWSGGGWSGQHGGWPGGR